MPTTPGLSVVHRDPRGYMGQLPAYAAEVAERIQKEVDPSLWVFWHGEQQLFWVMMAKSITHQEPIMAIPPEDFDHSIVDRLRMADTQNRDVQEEQRKHNAKVQERMHKDALETDAAIYDIVKFYMDKQFRTSGQAYSSKELGWMVKEDREKRQR